MHITRAAGSNDHAYRHTLSLGSLAGLSSVSGNGSASLVVRGSLASLNTALSGLAYLPGVNYSGPDTLSLVLDDLGNTGGGALSAGGSVGLSVIYNPTTISGSPGTLAYVEKDPATPVEATLTLTAGTVPNLSGATITISANYASGQDVLAFTSQPGISGSWDAASGTLTLSGSASVASYEAALRSVTYVNTSANPSALTRNLTFALDDGVSVQSLARQVSVTPVNDPPVLANNTLTVIQGGAVVLGSAQLGASDPDNPASALVYSVSALQAGRFEFTTAPGVAVSSFTQADINAGLVRFVQDGSANAPAYAVSVSDGSVTVGPYAGSVVFVATPLPSGSAPAPKPSAPPPPAIVLASTAAQNSAKQHDDVSTLALANVISPGRVIASFNDLAESQIALAPIGKRAGFRLIQPVATLNTYDPTKGAEPQLAQLDLTPAQLQFRGSVPIDWAVAPAFEEGFQDQAQQHLQMLLDSVKFGGMALSVGVVWWASRVSGLLGSLIASAPAWRHIDPLPVVGRDEDEEEQWYEPDNRDADANELAVSLVLDGAKQQPAAGA